MMKMTGFRDRLNAGLRLCAALLLGMVLLADPALAAGSRERLSLDGGWLFHLGDVAGPAIKGHGMSYANGKANGSFGAAGADFDDSAWRRLDLPHDWAVEGPFDKNENASQGYRPRGIGWYRRYLQLPVSDRGRHVELQLDAVATHSTVWVNGIVANRNYSGYNGRSIDITPYLRYGEEVNTVAVRVDADAQEGWWYEGAGMYRHAWLVKRDALHIATDGLHANPVQEGKGWTLPVTVDLASSAKVARAGVLEVTLLDPEGREVARGSTRVQVQALKSSTAQLKLTVQQPRLWSLEQPNVYRVRAVLRDGNAEIDRTEVQTGFRSLRFDADRGFFLNGQPVKVQGVAIHQDHAGVGVAVPDSIWEFRLRQLKSMGVNAIRFAHGAIAAEVLDMTDRMGLLVLNENRNFNTSPEVVERQLAWLVRRDRNHPSVFMWSIFNEEPLQGSEVGYEIARRTVDVVKTLDPTRPVTAAMHDGIFGELNVTQVVDVAGINYQTWAYDRFHQQNPKRPMTSTEDTASYMTRGAFESDPKAQVMATYDEEPSSFGTTHRKAWRAIAERPFVAGGFIWTGLDYRGEPTPYEWPSVNSFFGAMDLCAYPKTAYWIHQAHWIKDRTVIKVVPHWNWAGREGQPIKVMVATNAPRVRLLLNGKVVGESDVDPIDMVSFQVPYAPGRLEAVALRNGSELARDAVETTGAPARLVLTPDRAALAGDGRDAVPVKVSVVDAQGRPVPTADALVSFEVGGAGTLIGVGNGDPNSHDSEKTPERKLFNGLAQVILQTRLGGQGVLTLRATAPGLESAVIAMDVKAVSAPPAVAAAEPFAKVGGWRISPPQATRPDPAIAPSHGDMNSWGWGDPPIKQEPESQPWRAYRASFGLRSDHNDGRGRLVFREIAGRAEVWMEGVKLGEKTDPATGPLTVPLPKGPGWRTVTVLLQAQPGQPSGLTGRVVVEKAAP
ncbi:beta-galactosidase GalA [Pelomonas sp. Root1217]|uniref:beta-galactosidase GalA n=1 Tax=Pelomonas sp. Root1217 TaxID=1736430 RepID=UPI000A6D742E|nr:beta-galactosidase GalA [Pelomonas sp. Root1217]